MAGYLKYQDTSTGQLLCEHRTKFGACSAMTQNLHNAVIHLGHQNGTVTLWTPNLPHPAVQLLAHLGPVTSVAVDPSQGGRYMATSGRDGTVKVWDCRNWKGAVRDWTVRGAGDPELDWSQRGFLGVATGGSVNVCVLLLILWRCLIKPCSGVQTSCNSHTPQCSNSPAVVYDTCYSPPPPLVPAVLSLPGYPDCGS